MKRFGLAATLLSALVMVMAVTLALSLGGGKALAQTSGQVPVTVVADLDPASATGMRIEGLASDKAGRLYTIDLDSRRFFRITPDTGAVETLGVLGRPGTGMAFDAAGNLYIASTDVVLRVPADSLAASPFVTTTVQTFATGLTGANGLAFGAGGELYVSGGATGNIYVVASDGMTKTFATGFTSEREAQRISTNGLAFGPDGLLYSSNTGTGAIDRIAVNADGTAGTVQRFATDPRLLGADGITFAANGDLYVAANERNAIVWVKPDGTVGGEVANGNAGPLEFPASPSFSGNALYASNFDIERGANAPNAPGVGASIARIDVGVAGMPLPFTGQSGQPAPTTVPAASTPTVAPPAPSTPTSTPVSTPEVVPTPISPEPMPTVEPPGMPRTGTAGSILLLVLLAGGMALIVGYALRRLRSTPR
jgi:sugar lactone lactonase YvrE